VQTAKAEHPHAGFYVVHEILAEHRDCALRSRSAPRTPMKSVPRPSNSHCAMSQGSCLNGGGNRSGSGIRRWGISSVVLDATPRRSGLSCRAMSCND